MCCETFAVLFPYRDCTVKISFLFLCPRIALESSPLSAPASWILDLDLFIYVRISSWQRAAPTSIDFEVTQSPFASNTKGLDFQ